MKTRFGVCTAAGRIRRENQDNFFLNGRTKPVSLQELSLSGMSEMEQPLFAVCDGMGGEEAGDVAAFLAVETLKNYTGARFFRQWKSCVCEMNREVCEYQKRHGLHMGTTFAGISFSRGRICAVNVGDSRIYRIREGQIIQLSRDHTEFQMMVEAGVFRAEDFSRTSARHHLTQYIGIPENDMILEPFRSEMEDVRDQDIYLICSDGLYGVVPDTDILDTIYAESPALCCERLVSLAMERRSKDNITALVVRVVEAGE